jgi:hypothetical protein
MVMSCGLLVYPHHAGCAEPKASPTSVEDILANISAPVNFDPASSVSDQWSFDLAAFARMGAADWTTLLKQGKDYDLDSLGAGYEIRFYPGTTNYFGRIQGIGLRLEGDQSEPGGGKTDISGQQWEGLAQFGRIFAPPPWMPMLTTHVSLGARGILDRLDRDGEVSHSSRWLGPCIEAGADLALPPWCFVSWNGQAVPVWLARQNLEEDGHTEFGGSSLETTLGLTVQPKEWLSLELSTGYQWNYSPAFDSGREERDSKWLQFMASFLF